MLSVLYSRIPAPLRQEFSSWSALYGLSLYITWYIVTWNVLKDYWINERINLLHFVSSLYEVLMIDLWKLLQFISLRFICFLQEFIPRFMYVSLYLVSILMTFILVFVLYSVICLEWPQGIRFGYFYSSLPTHYPIMTIFCSPKHLLFCFSHKLRTFWKWMWGSLSPFLCVYLK